MAKDLFDVYLEQINEAYLRGDATEHTHRPALKALIEAVDAKVTATNEPTRVECGAPDFVISRRVRRFDQTIGYLETKDIHTDLKKVAKTEQIKRYVASQPNFILTDYIVFWWYVNGEIALRARLAEERAGQFKGTEESKTKVRELLQLFLQHEPERIGSAKVLSVRMAGVAHLLQGIIFESLIHEDPDGPLHGQFKAFREVLIHDLTEKQFADMYAQTIAYGLFTARCHIEDITLFGVDEQAAFHGMDERSKEFTREHAAYLLPKTNPFLRKMFGHIAGPDLDERIGWLVDDLVALLREADMGEVLRDFAKRKERKDPVFHFYETFLGQYDPKMKKVRGVYYTPEPVVSYIVRSVDYLLKKKFGLKRGLADESKVKTDKGEVHKVLILDPAVGTGTFLFEVIDLIHARFTKQKGMWSGYVREHLLPRLFGFELMMAPYAIAHMKLGLELAELGYDFESDERLGIYLTNTLEEAEKISKNVFVQWLSEEARAASEVKKELPIMVVTGNPPYAGLSANMNEWIEQLLKNKLPGENGAQSYYEVDRQPLGEKKVWLQDDYVKFIRFGQLRIEQSGYGILAFITNHSYLDNPTFRGMRQSLMQTFDEIYVLDLHGNQKKKETCPDGSKDVNVFDIQQGVSIGIFVRQTGDETPAKIYHGHLYGLRKTKYEWLTENDIKTTGWNELSPNSPYYFFVPKDESKRKEYEQFYKINEIMPGNNVGIVTARDKLTIHQTVDSIWSTVKDFASLPTEEARSKYSLGKDAQSWKVRLAQEDLNSKALSKNKITPILYRPFDIRYTYYTGNSGGFICRPIYKVMKHMLVGNNIGFSWTRPMSPKYEFSVLITSCIIDQCAVGNKSFGAGISYIGPLYIYSQDKNDNLFEASHWPASKDGRKPNLAPAFVEELAEKIELDFVSDGFGDLKKTFGPEDVLHYIYGVFHSPEYRRRYAEFLKIDFPRIPWPKGRGIFREVAKAGGELVKLHLMEHEILEEEGRWPSFPLAGSGEVEKGYPKYVAHAEKTDKERVYINNEQYFEGVRPEIWEFHIGGYHVCEKWLKDRRGRKLDYDDINHYQKVVVALAETIKLMGAKCLAEMFE